MIHRYTWMKVKRLRGHSNCINLQKMSKCQKNNKYFYSCVTTLLGTEASLVNEFRLIFSSFTAENMKLARVVAN